MGVEVSIINLNQGILELDKMVGSVNGFGKFMEAHLYLKFAPTSTIFEWL
jgi:hypothetical protein